MLLFSLFIVILNPKKSFIFPKGWIFISFKRLLTIISIVFNFLDKTSISSTYIIIIVFNSLFIKTPSL
jgi:hypothetical protein